MNAAELQELFEIPARLPVRSIPKPEALLTTPSECTWCPLCERAGVRFFEAGDPTPNDEPMNPEFAHCPECGSTELLDVRSPFEVLAEANRNACDGTIDPGLRMARQDVAFRVAAIVSSIPADHLDGCDDCRRWARIVGVR